MAVRDAKTPAEKIAELEDRVEKLQRVVRSLADDERKYREIVESANSIIISVDRQGRLTYLNEYAERFFGYRKSEVLGKRVVGTIVPEMESSGRNLEELIGRIIEEPEAFRNNENETVTKNGRRLWVSWTNRAMRDDAGRLVGILGVGNDVTPLKEMERVLRDSKAEWETLFDAMSDWVALIDRSRTIVRTNRAGERFLGLPLREIAGKSCCALIHGVDAAVDGCPFLTMLRTGKRESLELMLPDEATWLHVSVDPVTDDDGNVTGAVHIVRDITAEKSVQVALRQSEERYRTLIETAEEGVWVIDRGARTSFANKKMAAMLGYTTEEMTGRSLFEFMDDEAAEEARQKFAMRREGLVEQHDFRFARKDRTAFWAIVSTAPLHDASGNFSGAVAMITDITERRRMEQDIEASRQQLRALSSHLESVREEERTRISREIHDELGQALTCIKIDISEMAADLRDVGPARGRLQEKAQGIMAFVDGTIETVRKISAELRPSILDDLGLSAAIDWLCQDFQRRTGIDCRIERVEVPSLGKGLATAFFRILQEGLTNVARHARATAVTVSFGRTEDHLMLVIEDNGRGLPPGTLDEDNALGLLGMRERAIGFGGEILFEGGPEGGTRITVLVPAENVCNGGGR